jgi:hypothetical protein
MYPDYNNKEHRDCIRRNLSNCGSGVIDEACEMIDALEAKVRELEATLAACKEAGFIDENGNVRKVLGTLPVTKDGVIAMPGTEVFHPNQDRHFHLEVMFLMQDMTPDKDFPLPEDCVYMAHYSYFEQDTGYSAYESYNVRDCYSTPEAAEKAREEHGKA